MIRATTSKINAVFIRKSSQAQDDRGQKANVGTMLQEIGVQVVEQNYFVGTVSRRKVKSNPEFNRLLQLVEADKVDTIYIEAQDRWGTADRVELFALLGMLRDHNTRLFDLRAKKDITENDFYTEFLAIIGSYKSEKELQDISYRSLRTRVANFKESGSWPTGPHPFGFGKACYSADGKILWVWQPESRLRGQLFYPDASGELIPGPVDQRIPQKSNRDNTFLVPSNNKEFVASVQLIFELYTRVGLSRRKISARLNAEGRRFYDKPFSHSLVTQVLTNPAYIGDTHFGKTRAGAMHSFDRSGLVVPIKAKNRANKAAKVEMRDVSERLVNEKTHEALIDRKSWKLAQAKLQSERERRSFSPRNPAYYLKQILICGHCGRNMTGRTEKDPTTGEKKVVYVCSTYMRGRCNGQEVSCGYQRITHEDAERLLLNKLAETGLAFDEMASMQARSNHEAQLARLEMEDEQESKRWRQVLMDGVDAFIQFINSNYDVKDFRLLQTLRRKAWQFYCLEGEDYSFTRLPVKLASFRDAIQAAEDAAVKRAEQELAKLNADLAANTRAWVRATEKMRNTLKVDIDKLEVEIDRWAPLTERVTARFDAVYAAEAEIQTQRQRLLAEWPTLESREKGESLRRLFKSVTLYWDRKFRPAKKEPTRPRKTDRPGRFSYAIQHDRTDWAFATSDLDGSW